MSKYTSADDDDDGPIGRLTPTIGIEEAGKLLHCHPDTVRKMAHAGEIPGAKIGRAWVFYTEQLLEWVAARCKAGTQSPRVTGGSALAERLRAQLERRARERRGR